VLSVLRLNAWLTVPEVFRPQQIRDDSYILWMAQGIWKVDMNSTCDVACGSIGSSISAGLFTCFISPYMMVLFP
jgi:hypothetical protein